MGKQKNVIFYFSDQQRWDTVNETLTPNLMKLAESGIKYDNFYTCQPVCGPARACLQSGMYATQNGTYRNALPLAPEIKPLASYFNEAGYDTAYIGKWHLASDGRVQSHFNSEKTAVPKDRQGDYRYWRAADILEFTSHGYDGYIFDEDEKKIEFKGYRADCINDFGLEFLQTGRDKEKPFFMFISQLEPHHQNDHRRHEGYRETVDDYKEYPIPEDLTFLSGDYEKEYPDYLSAINRLDYNVGRLVDKLKELDLFDDTVIIYTSDHGSHFKTRNAEYKRSCHDSSIHVPLVIHGGNFKGGVVENRLASLIDIPPTLLSMAGIQAPENYSGYNIGRMLESDEVLRECAFVQISESQIGRAIRTKRFTYCVSALGGVATGWAKPSAKRYFEDYLYDNEKDPHQKKNLVKDRKLSGTRYELREMLMREMRNAGEATPKIFPRLCTPKK